MISVIRVAAAHFHVGELYLNQVIQLAEETSTTDIEFLAHLTIGLAFPSGHMAQNEIVRRMRNCHANLETLKDQWSWANYPNRIQDARLQALIFPEASDEHTTGSEPPLHFLNYDVVVEKGGISLFDALKSFIEFSLTRVAHDHDGCLITASEIGFNPDKSAAEIKIVRSVHLSDDERSGRPERFGQYPGSEPAIVDFGGDFEDDLMVRRDFKLSLEAVFELVEAVVDEEIIPASMKKTSTRPYYA